MAREGLIQNPGWFRHRITFEKKTMTGQDSFGQDIFEWRKFVTVPCRVVALTGRELVYANEVWAEARFRIEMHYVAGIEREMRGVWGARILDILDAEDPWGTRMAMYVTAKGLAT